MIEITSYVNQFKKLHMVPDVFKVSNPTLISPLKNIITTTLLALVPDMICNNFIGNFYPVHITKQFTQ